jgi:hypothetical protein
MTGEIIEALFPAQLLNWARNRSGGVRRLFDAGSGRLGQVVFETNLLHRLEAWANLSEVGPNASPASCSSLAGREMARRKLSNRPLVGSTHRWVPRASFPRN